VVKSGRTELVEGCDMHGEEDKCVKCMVKNIKEGDRLKDIMWSVDNIKINLKKLGKKSTV
jgi:hypothetical protein